MSGPRPPRLAAGRARALGLPTRGTTAPNRLRRIDRWLLAVHGGLLRSAPDPLVVDLGFGASPVTTVELHQRLAGLGRRISVVGLEIDADRVAVAQEAQRDGLTFALGGFELAGLRPQVVRAFNVLRQYEETAAAQAWSTMTGRLAPDGVLLEGTCNEVGRRASWVTLGTDGPRCLTLAAHLPSLDRPSDLAERLPKALIHHNVPGEAVHELFAALDAEWERMTPLKTFGPTQRWVATCERLVWPQLTPRRARFGELTVPWESVAPGGT